MSARIDGNAIYLTRGDTFIAQIEITQGDEPYTPAEGDVIIFAVKNSTMTLGHGNYTDATPIISKTIPNTDLILQLDPADTAELDFGNYVYDVSITFADSGVVDTFITASPFIITAEVHTEVT